MIDHIPKLRLLVRIQHLQEDSKIDELSSNVALLTCEQYDPIFFSLILLFAAGCDSNSAANNKEALEKTDGKDEIVLDENNIKSIGPNGEKATPASSLTLTDEEIEKIK